MLARLRSTFEERGQTEDFATRLLAWAGAYTILFVGAAHILICGEHFLVATYLGLAFVANFLGSLVVAASLFLGERTWAWLLGDLVAGGALVGFVVSRTIGLPGAPEFVGQWLNIAGLLTLGFDALFIALSLLALTPQGQGPRRGAAREDRAGAGGGTETTPGAAVARGCSKSARAYRTGDVRDPEPHGPGHDRPPQARGASDSKGAGGTKPARTASFVA